MTPSFNLKLTREASQKLINLPRVYKKETLYNTRGPRIKIFTVTSKVFSRASATNFNFL